MVLRRTVNPFPSGKQWWFDSTLSHSNLEESEGFLMIITYDALVGYVNIIIFQLAIFGIVLATKSSEAVHEGCKDMLAFSVLAIPTRHEVTC